VRRQSPEKRWERGDGRTRTEAVTDSIVSDSHVICPAAMAHSFLTSWQRYRLKRTVPRRVHWDVNTDTHPPIPTFPWEPESIAVSCPYTHAYPWNDRMYECLCICTYVYMHLCVCVCAYVHLYNVADITSNEQPQADRAGRGCRYTRAIFKLVAIGHPAASYCIG